MPNLSHRCQGILLGVAMAIGCLGFGLAHANDAVLLASTVPGYMPGMTISTSDRLSLPEGASATLLFQSGEMLRLRGPFDGTLGQSGGQATSDAGNGGVATIAEMFRMQGADATVIGGTRSTNLTRSSPLLEDVEVDPQRSGTYCVEPATSVWITRPAIGPDGFAVRRKGSSRALSWPAGADRMEWPSDVPIEDGGQFEITTRGNAIATVTFRGIPATVGGGAALIANGLLLGCRDQFDIELHRLSRSAVQPEVWITSDHGRRPTYHAGEPIVLTVMTNMDGYLYCVLTGEEGSARPLFPAGAVDGALFRGSVPLSIPGLRQQIGLIAAPGTARIRCWLADRDITPELPHALLGSAAVRLPDQLAADLDGLFGRITGTRIEADVLTIKTQ